MFLSRVTLLPPNPQAFFALVGPRMRADDPSFAHKLIWTLFADAPDASRDFLFHVTERQPFQALVRSERQPVDGLGCWKIETLPFQPALRSGLRLAFALNAVATKWEKAAQSGQRGRPHDAVMAEWKALPAERQRHVSPDEIADPVGRDWLARQGAVLGFDLDHDQTRVLRYERHRFPNKGRSPITVGSLSFQGELTVTAPAAFAKALKEGIGRQKAFGFGMLHIALPSPS